MLLATRVGGSGVQILELERISQTKSFSNYQHDDHFSELQIEILKSHSEVPGPQSTFKKYDFRFPVLLLHEAHQRRYAQMPVAGQCGQTFLIL